MKKIAMITGATAGIGKATAILLASNGYDIIITGRREKLLTELVSEIKNNSESDVLTLCFDVRNKEEVDNNLNNIKGKWAGIDLLVNNAGLAVGLEPVHDGVVDDWERMIDTNIKGLLYVTRKISSQMVNRRSGHIINVSSIAGKEAYPYGAVYCGTKHAVSAITKAMRIELVEYGIKVGSICPGMVDTEFSDVRFKGDKEKADSVYKGLTPLYAEDIAETILFMANRPPHVNIDDVLIMATNQASARDIKREI
jgi:NADP-dependent 3-hydroxy acid dehydrogenase YdfG